MRQPLSRVWFHLVRTSFTLALLLVFGGQIVQPAAFAQDDTIIAMSMVSSTTESTGKTLQAKIMIDAPPSLVWETITNYPEIKHIFPGYEKSTVLKSNGPVKTVDIGMKVSPFLPAYHYQVQMNESQPGYYLNIKRIAGDFKSLHASYKLIPQNNGTRTLLVYNLNLDTGMNLPGSQGIIKSTTERSMRAIERHVMQEARKSLIGQR